MHYSHPFAAIERKPTRLSKQILNSVGISLLFAAIAWVSLTLLGIYELAWSGPFRDIWEFIGDISAQLQGEWSWAYLSDAYGGAHRILLPKLIFFLDYRFFHGSNFLTQAVSLICQCISLLLCWQLWRQSHLLTWQRLLLLSGMIAALFHAGQLFNFLYAMDVQWFMANTLALSALILSAKAQTWGKMWLALVFAILASLCNFTGLMAVLLVWISGYFLIKKQSSNTINFSFAFLVGAYIFWYVKTGKSNENFILASFLDTESIKHLALHTLGTLLKIIPFTLKMLSNPFSREWPITGSLLAFSSVIFLLRQTWQLRKNSCTLKVAIITWCWYIVLGCAFTALGRILYPSSATAERYLTLTLPYVVLIISLLWLHCRTAKSQLAAGILLIPFGMFFYSSSTIDSLEKMTITSQQQHMAQAAARSEILGLDEVRGSLSFPMANKGHNAVAEFNDWLAETNLGYFAAPPFYRLHDSWRELTLRWSPQSLPVCTGQLQREPLADSDQYRIGGQLLHPSQHVQHIIFSDGETIVGFAYNHQPAAAWLPWRDNSAEHWYFAGYIQHATPISNYQVLGMSKHGQALCYAELSIP